MKGEGATGSSGMRDWVRISEGALFAFFSAEQRLPTERNESVTEVKRMERLAGAV